MIKCIKQYTQKFSKVSFYDKVLWKNYLADIGILSSFVTLLSFFFTAQECKYIVWMIVGFVILLVVIFMYKWWHANHLDNVELKINNTKVSVKKGDIFELLDKKPEERSGEVSVIAVNDFYDTIVDNRIIAKSSLHGQYIKRLIKAQKLKEFDKVISTDEILNEPSNRRDESERVKGKKVRYSIGSVVEFESYVLAAFTSFDEDNKAYVTAEEYTKFWMRFWKNIDEIYAGRTINIPLIGAGITRFHNGKPTKQELLEIMLWSMKISGFHNTYGNKRINFIIYEADIEEIDFYHIRHNQNFR